MKERVWRKWSARNCVFRFIGEDSMKRIIPFFSALLLLLISSTHARQRQPAPERLNSERRIALVIGNSAYPTAPLKNPVNDAQDIARALEELGFEIVNKDKMLNLTQNEMKRAINTFGAKLRKGGVGLFYFAGHGIQVKGINYLVPVDAKVESEEEVEYECVDAGRVLAQMESAGNQMNVVILDACRNNPFARNFRSESRGLAMMEAPSGSLIAYATAPGSVAADGKARNGIYTQELLGFMRAPGLEIESVFKRVRISVRTLTQGKQTPWESSSLIGSFYFKQSGRITQPPQSAPKLTDSVTVRYDGLYRALDRSYNTSGWLRFYEDGTVIGVSSVFDATPENISQWLKKPYTNSGLYIIRGSNIEFSLTSAEGTVDYSGSVSDDALTLRWYSHINGHGGTTEYKFIDLK